MSDKIQIFYNPDCSKCRHTLDILTAGDNDVSIREYLKTPPDSNELSQLLDLLGIGPRELMRKQEAAYRENNLDDAGWSREQLIQAMLDNPVLIERPIVIKGKRAVIGRPPEKVLEIL